MYAFQTLTQRLQSRFANQASTSRIHEDIKLPGYLFEESPVEDPGSLSNWYDFSDNEEELSNDTDTRFSDSEEPSSPKEVPYFDVASAGLVGLEASEDIVEEPPLNLLTEDFIQKIDLGTPDNLRPVFINPKIAVHKLNMQKDIKPVKQGQRRLRPNVMDKIELEVQKLKIVGFIREEQHPKWLANIVPVTKKNGQIRVCIDYRDLNGACSKDEFPLPIPEIKMHPEDEKHTSFRTPFGVYCYTVMPFGLKNAGATYQRAMMKIFQDMQHKTVECYVDDLAVKSQRKEDRLKDLQEVFLRLCKHKLRMNPLKCFFGVSSRKFLGFIVWKAGIELDPTKVKAILEMPSPRTLRELKGLQRRLAYIRRFISNLSRKCRPFSRLMKKGVDFVWVAECEAAFQDIKSYLTKPPVLAAPTTGKPFILYTRALNYSLGALLAQENDGGKETALYYLSRMLVGAEHHYSPVEKECLAVMFAVQKLRHYLLSNTALPQKAIKGQTLADFFEEHPLPKDSPLKDDLPDEPVYSVETSLSNASWDMYFDGATRTNEKEKLILGIGIIFVSPNKYMIPHAFSLLEPCSNNAAEFQALIVGLELALKSGITMLEAFGNSQLIVNQMNQKYEIRKPDLLPYYNKAQSLRQKFDVCHITHIRRGENIRADALAGLAASMVIQEGEDMQITVCQKTILPPVNTHQAVAECHQVVGSQISILRPPSGDWRDPFIDYIMFEILPEDPKERVSIQRRAPNFHLDIPSKMLYRKSFNGVLLCCLSQQEADETLKEVHTGLCRAHQLVLSSTIR
ncbi:hypothetical protein AAC387_Pa01g2429 [Persea americana]